MCVRTCVWEGGLEPRDGVCMRVRACVLCMYVCMYVCLDYCVSG